MIQLHLTGPIGTQLTVAVEHEKDILPTLRRYGQAGYTSGALPCGGLTLPYANHADFDWALIGARPYTNAEGEACVMYKGQSYKRRDLEAVDSKKMKLPAVVKYSRGARPTDPPHLKEGEDGGVQYVTLISFRGGGKKLEQYAVLRQNLNTPNAAD